VDNIGRLWCLVLEKSREATVYRTAICITIVLLCGGLAPPVHASQIHHAPLEDVLSRADWVTVATVTEVEVREDNVHKLYTWTVRKDRELWSKTPVPDLPLMYSHRWPVMHDADGRIIGTISPIYDGSGLEHDVRQDQTWIFMGKAPGEGAQVLFVDRVEPLDLEESIVALLLARHASSSATSASLATPYPPPSSEPGDDGWQLYQDATTWSATTATCRPTTAGASDPSGWWAARPPAPTMCGSRSGWRSTSRATWRRARTR
jgi:hypothetical protein